MTLHNHSLEVANSRRDSWIVGGGNRVRIEEAPAIVELDLARRRQLRQSIINLRRNSARRQSFCQRVLPQVAHEAAPGAFSIRQEDRRDRDQFAGFCPLLLQQKGIGTPRVERISSCPPR